MMSKQTVVSVAMGLVLATAASTTWAEGGGFYFGVTGGQAQADLSKGEIDDVVLDSFASAGVSVLSATSDLDDSDASMSLFGGYRFSQYLALEAGYVDFGTAEYRASGTVDPPGPVFSVPATYSTDYEAKGFTVAAIGALPLNQMFDLHARIGALLADTEMKLGASIGSGSATDRLSSDSLDLFYGAGAGMHLGTHWSFSLDWQQFKDVGDDDDFGETDIDRISLGVIFRL